MSTKRQKIEGVVARIERLRRTMSIDRPGRRMSPLKISSPKTSPVPRDSTPQPSPGSGDMSCELRSRGRKSPREEEMNKVQEELEKLNIATDVINKLELQLDDARSAFGEIRSSWSGQLEALSRKLGGCIAKSRPFYEARLRAKAVQEEAQKAALRFERANSMHGVAKQQVSLTQDSLFRQDPADVDPACLEVLNHHVQRVNEAEVERLHSEEEHRRISLQVEDANRAVQTLEKDLGRHIKKSKTYFDRRLEFTRVLEDQKALIQRIEAEVRQKKADYQGSLTALEHISERIHEQRRLGRRGSGVGAEEEPPTESAASPRTPDESVPTVMIRIDAGRSPPPVKKGLSPKVKDLLKSLSPGPKEDTKSRAVSEPPDPAMILGGPAEPSGGRDRGGSLSIPKASGVLLVAQQLSEYAWLGEDKSSDRAFSFPPEDLDVSYKTLPQGVKAFPSPPETPKSVLKLGIDGLLSPRDEDGGSTSDRSDISAFRGHSRQPSNFSDTASFGGNESDGSSLSSSVHVEDEVLRGMLRSHTAMISEIEATADRVKTEVADLPAYDRQSASGESS